MWSRFRFRPFAYEDLLNRDRVSLDIFWLKDESLEGSAIPATRRH
jgi:type I restriction enzyme M protein